MLSVDNSEKTKIYSEILWLQFLILICFVCIVFGCGRKGPPVPPQQIVPPRVKDLVGIVEGDILTLTWTVPQPEEFISSAAEGFFVFRSKKPLSEPDCKDCPVLFTRVADIPIKAKNVGDFDKDIIEYSETIKKGSRYIYKVNVYAKGILSSDSNYFDIIFE